MEGLKRGRALWEVTVAIESLALLVAASSTVSGSPSGAVPYTLGPRVDLSDLELSPRPPPSVLSVSLGGFMGPSFGGTGVIHAGLRAGVGLSENWWVGALVSLGLGENTNTVDGLGEISIFPVAALAATELCPLEWLCAELAAGPEWLIGRARGARLFQPETVVKTELRVDARARFRYSVDRLSLHVAAGVQGRPLGTDFEIQGVSERFGPEPWALVLEVGVDVWLTPKKTPTP